MLLSEPQTQEFGGQEFAVLKNSSRDAVPLWIVACLLSVQLASKNLPVISISFIRVS